MQVENGNMPFVVRCTKGYPEQEADDLASLQVQPLGRGELESYLRDKSEIYSCFAYIEERMVGYKIGYQDRPYYFESWIGAVLPQYRRRGIATALMNAQHQWCQQAGYRVILTITEGNNQPMLITNLKAGFEICGTFLDRKKILKVIQQKMLLSSPEPPGP